MPRKAGLGVLLAALLLIGCSQALVPAPPPLPPLEESVMSLHTPTTRWTWSALAFHDDQRGWAALARDGGSALYRTEDGGKRWTRTGAPAFVMESLMFPTAQQGIAMGAAFGCAVKGQECAVLIATTGDGGATWETRYRYPLPEGISSNPPTVALAGSGAGYAFYVGSSDSLLVTTHDGGVTWIEASDPAPGWAFQSAAFVDGVRGWTHARHCEIRGGQDFCRYAIFATSDGGRVWRRQFDLPEGRRFRPGNISFVDERNGWLYPTALAADCAMTGCAGPIYRTGNGGKTWEEVRWAPDSAGFPLQVGFADPERGWMLMNNGIGTTADGGKTWTRHRPDGMQEVQLVSAPSALVAWAVVSGPAQPGALVRTTDGGLTWTLVPAPPIE